MSKTRKVAKVFLAWFIIILTLMLLVVTIRTINSLRYAGPGDSHSFQMGDMDAYPLEQDGVSITIIKAGTLNGFHILPEEKKAEGLIVTFGGSEGGCNYFDAVKLGQWGYEVIAMFYYGQDNQPALLNRVPIDFFPEFITWAEKNEIPLEPLTLLGGSKGAELALVLAEYFEGIDHLILYAPSCYVFQGMDFQHAASSWTYRGQELPFVSYNDASFLSTISMLSGMLLNYPMTLRPLYESAMANSATIGEAQIRLTQFDGDILLFAGAKDELWPSNVMAEAIAQAHGAQAELHIYPKAGHSFGSPEIVGNLCNGGSALENDRARQNSDEKLKAFLGARHVA